MYMTAMFSMHAVVQLLLTIVAPALLVHGAPVTLALQTLRAAGYDAASGPREWLESALHSPVIRTITQPWTALGVFAVGVIGLSLPAVFEIAISDHAAHMAMIGYFLCSGILLFAGGSGGGEPVPTPRRVQMPLVASALYALVGIVVMNMQNVLGDAFYRSLKLDWRMDLLSDQRLGGQINAAGGVLAVLTVIAILLVQRYRPSRKAGTIPAPGLDS